MKPPCTSLECCTPAPSADRVPAGAVRHVVAFLLATTVGSAACSMDAAVEEAVVSDRAAQPVSSAPESRETLLFEPEDPAWSEAAPDTSDIVFETSRGDFVIQLVRDWAPVGVDRFYNLVRHGYYDDVRFHRVVPGFITQWGVSGHPARDSVWYDRGMPDDPVVASNERGTVAFAFTEPGTRSTQIYISMADNSRLDAQGFAPIGRVVRGMNEVVDSIYSGYGEESGGGVRNGDQSPILASGNDWLDTHFPRLDRLVKARPVGGDR